VKLTMLGGGEPMTLADQEARDMIRWLGANSAESVDSEEGSGGIYV
jgi:hypothetical protein